MAYQGNSISVLERERHLVKCLDNQMIGFIADAPARGRGNHHVLE
jgi:hypothetical protein